MDKHKIHNDEEAFFSEDDQLKVESTEDDLKKSMNEEEKLEFVDENQSKTQEEIAGLKDQLLRALAEVENVRRRGQRDKEETQKYAITAFARDLLNVADNLHRALESVTDRDQLQDGPLKTLLDGVEMTERQLLATFEKHHVKKFEPLHEKFDSHHHQAMFEIPDTTQTDGTVVQVLQAGYKLHDRLLRPAMVGVAKNKSD
ncbi:MAG: nucleotide exchange factor GrpE [Alphaproteobacteria bacterium]|nr:nucleotide exchange factor GrpE [Alphaproteobacteria bacterium]